MGAVGAFDIVGGYVGDTNGAWIVGIIASIRTSDLERCHNNIIHNFLLLLNTHTHRRTKAVAAIIIGHRTSYDNLSGIVVNAGPVTKVRAARQICDLVPPTSVSIHINPARSTSRTCRCGGGYWYRITGWKWCDQCCWLKKMMCDIYACMSKVEPRARVTLMNIIPYLEC